MCHFEFVYFQMCHCKVFCEFKNVQDGYDFVYLMNLSVMQCVCMHNLSCVIWNFEFKFEFCCLELSIRI
jgi:hypothetical protein